MSNSFIEYISNVRRVTEDINVIDGKLVFNDSSGSGISTSFGKGSNFKPFRKVVSDNLISSSLYNAKVKNKTELLNAVKYADFNSDEVKAFLTRTAIYAARVIRELGVEVIVMPKSSSDLNKELAKLIGERMNIDIYMDSFAKTVDVSKIKIDVSNPKLTDTIKVSLEKSLERGIKRGNVSVKLFLPHHRKFITGLFDVTDERLLSKIENKKVLILDDVMTSGTTAMNINNILMLNGAESVSIMTIFKVS